MGNHKMLNAAQAGLDGVKAKGAVPAECGPDIPVAPARGAFKLIRPVKVKEGSSGTLVDDGYQGPGEARSRRAIQMADIFDAMDQDQRRRAGGEAVVPWFSAGQVAMARRYRALVEKHATAGVKLSSLGGSGGAGGQGGFAEAFFDEGREIAMLQRRIGDGVALAVRRVRPSARGEGARVIQDRVLVDQVCLHQVSLRAVLEAHSWAGFGKNIEALRKALGAALDRMQGFAR